MTEDYLTDDEQVEVVKRWIAENWLWVVAGVVIGGGSLFGYRSYIAHREGVALQASATFGSMTEAVDRNDKSKARSIAEGLIKDFPKSPYADQAQLTLARLSVDEGTVAAAVAPLTLVMNNSQDAELKQIARLRLARVEIALDKPDDALQTLNGDLPASFASRIHEVRGDAFVAKHDTAAALKEYQSALSGGDAADSGLLQLKIADLGAPAAPSIKVTPAVPSNKVKP